MSSNAQGTTPRNTHLSLTSAQGLERLPGMNVLSILNFHARTDFQAHATVVHDLWALSIAMKTIAGRAIIKINNE